ncbi:hypothetical protein [Alkalimarinus sediminis]|uniref:Uncharacterized protein n=1 Tax=Alkalimarinus sediminis TaxID=1632866 RepID=A0A9E8HGY7_9ALTE|nr:hypothetical protein [Alkalimarinus sediminis]UZW74229.1 hypothetical protein NNL22_14550 [Alkalimarinus sediminis]
MDKNFKPENIVSKLYYQVEPFFPDINRVDSWQKTRILKENSFRIGLWCLLRSETKSNLYDIGYFNSVQQCVDVTIYGLTFDQAKEWFLEKAEKEKRISDVNVAKAKKDDRALFIWVAVIVVVLALYVLL